MRTILSSGVGQWLSGGSEKAPVQLPFQRRIFRPKAFNFSKGEQCLELADLILDEQAPNWDQKELKKK